MDSDVVRKTTAQPWWRLLAWSFLLGAVIDLGFGIGILAFQETLAPLLAISLPTPRVYIDLCGLLLVGLGAIYLCVFFWPQRMAPIAAIATLLRFGGLALFVATVLTHRADPAFWNFAVLDGVLAFLHLLLLRLAAGGVMRALSGVE